MTYMRVNFRDIMMIISTETHKLVNLLNSTLYTRFANSINRFKRHSAVIRLYS